MALRRCRSHRRTDDVSLFRRMVEVIGSVRDLDARRRLAEDVFSPADEEDR